MDFCSALKLMRQGVELTRPSWQGRKVYLDDAIFWSKEPRGAKFPCVFLSPDILADDWNIVPSETGRTLPDPDGWEVVRTRGGSD